MPSSKFFIPINCPLLLVVGFLTATTIRQHHATAFVPPISVCATRSSRMILPVSASPVPLSVDPTANDDNNNNNNNNNNNKHHDENKDDTAPTTTTTTDNVLPYKTLLEANMALDVLATKCGDIREPVISLADQCQSQWELLSLQEHLTPDVVSFNTVLKAWNRCAQSLADVKKHADLYASNDKITTQISNTPSLTSGRAEEHPQVYTAKDAAERATLLLFRQEQDYDNGEIGDQARPDTLSYNEAMSCWAKSGVAEAPQNAEKLLKRLMDSDHAQPDSASYGAVLDAWAYSGKPESLQKVKQIWEHMEQHPNIKPSVRVVNSIVQAHTKRVQELSEQRDVDGARAVAKDAEEYLDMMKKRYEQTNDPDFLPDVMTYTSVMDAYGRVGRYHATLRAQALLDELHAMHQQSPHNPRLKPNFRSYTCLIAAWSKTRSPDSTREAERLLQIMMDSSDPDMQPNARSFTSVIQTWARSQDPTKAQRALQLLRTMKDVHQKGNKEAEPSIISYNAALDACARNQGSLAQQTGALKIAFAILKAVQQDPHLEANSMTYSSLLRCCTHLLPEGAERNKVATTIFEKAQKAGMVDFYVLFNLRNTVETPVLKKLLESEVKVDNHGNYDFNAVPAAWNRNVRST